MTVTFEVFTDIQLIFHGNSPDCLEIRACKITVREGRETRDQVPQRQLQLILKALCAGLSPEHMALWRAPSPLLSPQAVTASGKVSKAPGRVR